MLQHGASMAGGTVEIKLNYARTPSTDGENGMRSSINGSTPPLALAAANAASKSSMSSASSSRLATCAPHATYNMRHATCNIKHATYHVRYAPCAMQDTACTAARVRTHRRAHACTRTGGGGLVGVMLYVAWHILYLACCMLHGAICMLHAVCCMVSARGGTDGLLTAARAALTGGCACLACTVAA